MKVRASCAASALIQSSSSPASGPADCQMAVVMAKKVRPAASLDHGTMTRASVSLTASGTSHTTATGAGAAASLSGQCCCAGFPRHCEPTGSMLVPGGTDVPARSQTRSAT
eukprot:scaffold34285_cov67-Phaeocystis_antarctica.AAC.3